jgi:hypothetical protein
MSIRQFQDLLASNDESCYNEIRQMASGNVGTMSDELDDWVPWG